jgi:plasmid stability protein
MQPPVLFWRSISVNLSIKGVPDAVAEALRARAERNHRSLQGELMAIVESAAADMAGRSGLARQAPLVQLQRVQRGNQAIEQVAAESRARHPKPVTRYGSSVDIIREMRDSR